MMNAINTFMLILVLALIIRIFSGFAAYVGVVRPLLKQRKKVPLYLREYNTKLIFSVSTFIFTCFGTTFFHLCRVGWVPNCSTEGLLDIITFINSIGLLAAWYVMKLMVSFKPKMPETIKLVKEIKSDVKEIREQGEREELRSKEIDANTEGEEGKTMRGRNGKKGQVAKK